MSERLRIIPKKQFEVVKKRFEILGISDETPLSAIEPITKGGLVPESREDLANLVEAPLLEACLVLFDKNIKTISSSANKGDIVAGKAYVIIDYGSLNERNKDIARTFGDVYVFHGSIDVPAVNLEIRVDKNTKVGQIRKAALAIVEKFEQQ